MELAPITIAAALQAWKSSDRAEVFDLTLDQRLSFPAADDNHSHSAYFARAKPGITPRSPHGETPIARPPFRQLDIPTAAHTPLGEYIIYAFRFHRQGKTLTGVKIYVTNRHG